MPGDYVPKITSHCSPIVILLPKNYTHQLLCSSLLKAEMLKAKMKVKVDFFFCFSWCMKLCIVLLRERSVMSHQYLGFNMERNIFISIVLCLKRIQNYICWNTFCGEGIIRVEIFTSSRMSSVTVNIVTLWAKNEIKVPEQKIIRMWKME